MSLNPSDDPLNSFGPSSNDADPAAHREQLLKKLNCLIAVLEAAIAKVRRNQEEASSDPDRLERIRVNLENTLTICQRAKVTLETRGTLPANLPPEVQEAVGAKNSPAAPVAIPARARANRRRDDRMSYRDYIELSSVEEFKKFKSFTPISSAEVAACDVDDLARRLEGC